jgi:hypothetical protein
MRRAAAAFLIVQLLVLGSGTALAASREYEPPFAPGSSGGDEWNYVDADAESARVTVGRFYPFPPEPASCPGRGGYANLEIRHRVTGPLGAVTVAYEDSAWDAYSFVTLLVKTTGGRWLGAKKVRGPGQGAGEIQVPIVGGNPRKGTTIRILFGLELASACPSFGGGSIGFTSVTVHPKGRR